MSTIHLISHTHWDREWYLTFQQFRLKLVHMVDGLLDILEHEPGYKYFMLDGQAIILEDYLQFRPERESDIKRFVKNGRLLIGPWYVSPDEFLVSPESHIRNLLEGKRICEAFGPSMQVGYLPDIFGHISQMPQILQGFGIDTVCVWRGLADEPAELLWKSPDGSTVLLAYLRDGYSNAANLSINEPGEFIKQIEELSLNLAASTSTGQILLMHGADHMEPAKNLPRAIHTFQDKLTSDKLEHSSLPNYFKAVRKQAQENQVVLPFVSGELRSSKRTALLHGVLSTHITLKQRNHLCETELLKWVEPLYAWMRLLDSQTLGQNDINRNHPFLADQDMIIRNTWKLLMQCHPHDSICGTSIDQVIREIHGRFDQVSQLSHALIDQDLLRISDQIDTRFSGSSSGLAVSQDLLSAIIVFNPNDQPQSGLINFNTKPDDLYSSIQIIDADNTSIPFHQRGLGLTELISISLDKKGLKQSLAMVQDGNVAGMVIRDFDIHSEGTKAYIRVTISDNGLVDLVRWQQGLAKLDEVFADDSVTEFIIRAYSDPEIALNFVARDVPGQGYRCYWIRGIGEVKSVVRGPKKLDPLFRLFIPVVNLLARIPLLPRITSFRKLSVKRQPLQIENEYFLVKAIRRDGTLTITDKHTNQVFTGLNQFIDGADCGDLYNYCPPQRDQFIHARPINIEHIETETSSKLVIHLDLLLPSALSTDRKSRNHKMLHHAIITSITLVPSVPRIDIHTVIDNQTYDHRLRVHFPASFPCSTAFYDGHFELTERSLGICEYDKSWVEQPRPEKPQRQFTMVKNDQVSLTIANLGLPEVEVLKDKNGNAEIALTMLRCVGWLSRDDLTTRKGHAGPMGITTPAAQMPGLHAFDYSIIPGGADLLPAIHQSYAFNAPLRVVNTEIHAGTLASLQSLLQNSNPNFLITTLKTWQDHQGLVVRGYNLLSSPIEVTLKPYRGFHQAFLLDLREEQIGSLPLTLEGQVTFQVAGKKIVTLGFMV